MFQHIIVLSMSAWYSQCICHLWLTVDPAFSSCCKLPGSCSVHFYPLTLHNYIEVNKGLTEHGDISYSTLESVSRVGLRGNSLANSGM